MRSTKIANFPCRVSFLFYRPLYTLISSVFAIKINLKGFYFFKRWEEFQIRVFIIVSLIN